MTELVGWEVAGVPAGMAQSPADLDGPPGVGWTPATVPGTVAGTLLSGSNTRLEQVRGDWSHMADLHHSDWWYRCRVRHNSSTPGRSILRAKGLATLASVWIDDRLVLTSANMFVEHEIDVSEHVHDGSMLYVCFSSLADALASKRPRPRWRSRLVASQNLRWLRATLLGSMPGWTPPIVPIGPWRPITISNEMNPGIVARRPRTWLDGGKGCAEFEIALPADMAASVQGTAHLGSHAAELQFSATGSKWSGRALIEISDAPIWWPHTHGDQPLHPARIDLSVSGQSVSLDLGRVGFRGIALDQSEPRPFSILVNDVPVFCRGASWMPLDVIGLNPSSSEYRQALESARDAGMNMLRIPGTTLYEDDRFYSLCDELGILVWQDFMFANLDYPDCASFLTEVEPEVEQLLERLRGRPCLALLCGNSEVQQQAAMLGWPAETSSNPLFDDLLPRLSRQFLPEVPYWMSSPSGGSLPFHTNAGNAHYWGVGAYRRPPTDARLASVGFATECLAFANIPDDRTLDLVLDAGSTPPQHQQWKSRSPRDAGAGWDFDDVRDHYFQTLFDADPSKFRSQDPRRYLELSRIVPGEIMTLVLAEWRRPASSCEGALIWHFQDLWPGPGWGVRDSLGRPKAAFWYLRRIFSQRACFFVDDGLNGVRLCVTNDAPDPFEATVTLTAGRYCEKGGRDVVTYVEIPPHAGVELDCDEMLGGFTDMGYVYRFGPPAYEIVHAELVDHQSGETLGSAFHFPVGHPFSLTSDLALQASLTPTAQGDEFELTLRSSAFAYAVSLDGPANFNDNFVHVAPDSTRSVTLRPHRSARDGFEVVASPLNSASSAIARWASQ